MQQEIKNHNQKKKKQKKKQKQHTQGNIKQVSKREHYKQHQQKKGQQYFSLPVRIIIINCIMKIKQRNGKKEEIKHRKTMTIKQSRQAGYANSCP